MGFRQSPVENLAVNFNFWKGKRVLVTGHTGFKGGWLSLWLAELGAEVHGYALAPNTHPNFFYACHLRHTLDWHNAWERSTFTQAFQSLSEH